VAFQIIEMWEVDFLLKDDLKSSNGEQSTSNYVINIQPGANPTIAIYNASVVNFYNATGSLEHFENKNIIFYF
jgi:hypothetical protein